MKRVVYSGFFDLFHAGHLGAFKEARKFGDYLIVHIAPDKEAKMVKGALRPVIPGKERAEMIEACKYVDEVFYEERYMTDEEVIECTKADVWIRNKGNTDKYDVEVGYISRYIPESGLDTTGIIKKIQSQAEVKVQGVNYILRVGDEVLLQQRDDIPGIRCPGMMAIPGGGLEQGENTHIAVKREMREETGIDLHGDKFNFLCDFKYPWYDIGRCYLIELEAKPEIRGTEGKMIWKKISEINDLAGGQEEILKLLKNK